jgi:LmbE family N-acetylglucosaminyl deacetylase
MPTGPGGSSLRLQERAVGEWDARELLDRATSAEDDPRPLPPALVVVAHADDEVIALGGRLSRWRNAVFLHATDSAPLDGEDARAQGLTIDQYRAVRRCELVQALSMADVPERNARQLEIADQRAALALPALTRAVLAAMRETRAQIVLTHPYEGGHPDHDACAFAVATAAHLAETQPVILEAAFYHQGPDGIETGCFLAAKTAVLNPEKGIAVERVLSPRERARKERLLHCFVTQREMLRYFSPDVEQFRLAPAYDFSRPPHEGTLFYERYPWGITGAQFRALAAQAWQQLAPQVAACR